MLSSQSLPWVLFIVLIREFAVMSVRLLAAKDGVVVAASFAGKLKTVMQMVSVIYLLAAMQAAAWLPANISNVLFLVGYAFIWIATIATVVSGIQYVWELRGYFKETTD